MSAADVALESGDGTSGFDRRGLLADVGARARCHVGFDPQDIASDVTEYLRDGDAGSRRIALLAAEREALPVCRLEQRAQLPGLFGELGIVRIELCQALRVRRSPPASRTSEACS